MKPPYFNGLSINNINRSYFYSIKIRKNIKKDPKNGSFFLFYLLIPRVRFFLFSKSYSNLKLLFNLEFLVLINISSARSLNIVLKAFKSLVRSLRKSLVDLYIKLISAFKSLIQSFKRSFSFNRLL